jgi:very-short-patch-repair endonuclease
MGEPSPASFHSAPSPARGRGAEAGDEVTSPLPRAGEGGAQRRVRAEGKKANAAVVSRKLRKASTEPEALLWGHLRNRHIDGFKFSRQYPIGLYFDDFVCREKALVVEVDGGQHSGSPHDISRDRFIRSAGYAVLRYWNNEVTENLEGVLTTLRLVLEGRPSPGLRYAPATLSRGAVEGKNEA